VTKPAPLNGRWRLARDILLFVGGLVGLMYETFFRTGDPRVGLITIFCAMLGLPLFLRRDESK
jgi:hypothetical protein